MINVITGAVADLVRDNNRLQRENNDLKAKLDYIALCDYPEIFEDEEEEEDIENG